MDAAGVDIDLRYDSDRNLFSSEISFLCCRGCTFRRELLCTAFQGAMHRCLIAAGTRTFSGALQPSTPFLCSSRIVFGRPAACRNVTVPASRFPVLEPMPHCKKLQQTARQG